jgi:hypothetical protein
MMNPAIRARILVMVFWAAGLPFIALSVVAMARAAESMR